jgi:hypothetical protein
LFIEVSSPFINQHCFDRNFSESISRILFLFLRTGRALLRLFLVLDEEPEENPQDGLEVTPHEVGGSIPARKSSEVGQKLENEFDVEQALVIVAWCWMVFVEGNKKSWRKTPILY